MVRSARNRTTGTSQKSQRFLFKPSVKHVEIQIISQNLEIMKKLLNAIRKIDPYAKINDFWDM